jgi:hypothetical protein
MSDPQSTNVGLYLPTRGSDVGTWDSPENANDSATDSLFANVATISLTNANVTLTTPPNTGASWSGPYQSQSGILKFTGTLTGNCTITIPRAGFFIVDNQCVVGAFYVRLGSSAPGKYVCAPPGAPTQIYCDGTDVSYVNLGPVGAALDLQGATAVPAWIANCTRRPYLLKDGTVYNFSDYPSLGRQLGSTFGGNGITTFAVPDERNRMRIPIDLNVWRVFKPGYDCGQRHRRPNDEFGRRRSTDAAAHSHHYRPATFSWVSKPKWLGRGWGVVRLQNHRFRGQH